jgi:hypothetical protein
LKVVTQGGWFAARPSGTEDICKIYAESFRGEKHLKRIQEEAMAMADRIAVIDHGKLQQLGSPRDLYERPENPFVADSSGSTISSRERFKRSIPLRMGDG